MYVCEDMLFGVVKFPINTVEHSTTQNQAFQPSFELLLGRVETPKQYRLLSLLLAAFQSLARPYCWRYHTLQTQDLEQLSWNWPKALSPRTDSHRIWSCYAICQGRKAINSFPRLQSLPRGKISPTVQRRDFTLGTTRWCLFGLKAYLKRGSSCLVL